MNINYELYRIFYEVAKYQNITKASNILNISQPAISKSIKNLETQLGGNLFIRTKRGVVLTEEGKEFYKYIEQAMIFIENGENKFNDLINLETGTIKIGINSTLTNYYLLPYLKVFKEKYPKIKIEIKTNKTTNLLTDLKNGLIDIAFIITNKKDYKEIAITHCKKIHDCLICNNQYKDLLKKEISLKELSNYPLIFQTTESNTRKHLDNILKNNNISLKPSIELASFSLVNSFTKNGFGIGFIIKEFVENELKNKELFTIKTIEKIPSRYISYAISKNHIPNFSTKKLIEIIKEV